MTILNKRKFLLRVIDKTSDISYLRANYGTRMWGAKQDNIGSIVRILCNPALDRLENEQSTCLPMNIGPVAAFEISVSKIEE